MRRVAVLLAIIVVGGSAALLGQAPPRADAASLNQRPVAPVGCSFAAVGTGTYAATVCWLDMASYNATQAATTAGQVMTATLPGGYTFTYHLHTSGPTVIPAALPTWSGSYLGTKGYLGVTGEPAIYSTVEKGSTNIVTINGISVTAADGTPVTSFGLVSADAESTSAPEWINWQSDTPLKTLVSVGPACGRAFTGAGTTNVMCTGASGGPTGTVMLVATSPTSMQVTMHAGGREAIAFGVLVSTVQLTVAMNGRASAGDVAAPTVTAANGSLVGTGSTGSTNVGSTGLVSYFTSIAGSTLTLSEAMSPGAIDNYDQSWACTRNGAADPTLPAGAAGITANATLAAGDFVDCSITNTPRPRSITVQPVAGTPTDTNQDGITDTGDTIPFTFTVTNTGRTTLNAIGVTTAEGSVTCPQTSLISGASEICTLDTPHLVTSDDETKTTVGVSATSNGTAPATTTVTTSPPAAASAPVATPGPQVSLVKTAAASSGNTDPLDLGETIAYSYLVTNTGNVRLASVAADDPTLGPVICPTIPPPGLDPGAAVTCTAQNLYTVSPPDILAGEVTDTATATGTDPDGDTSPTSTPSTVTVHTAAPAPRVTITETATVTPAADAGAAQRGDTISYTYQVTNTGNVALTSVAVSPASGSATCPSIGPGGLAIGASVTCTGDAPHTVTQDDVNAGMVRQDSIASTTAGVKSNPAQVMLPAVARKPRVTLAKNGEIALHHHARKARLGERIAYSFLVTNVGNVSLKSIEVHDPHLGAVRCPSLRRPLDPGHSVTCVGRKKHLVTQADISAGRIVNVATAKGTAVSGGSSRPSKASTSTIATLRDKPVQAIQTDEGRSRTLSDPALASASGILILILIAAAVAAPRLLRRSR